MPFDRAAFDAVWTDWQRPGPVPLGGRREKERLRQWLSESLRAEMTEKAHGPNWVMWESPRSLPAGLLVRRTLIACVLPDPAENWASGQDRFQQIRSHAQRGDVLLLVFVGHSEIIEELAKQSLSVPCAALLRDDVERLLTTTDHNAVLRDILQSQVGLIRLNPYASAGAVGQAMFFDRKRDVDRLISLRTRPVAVVGQRGIGKSSLLRHVCQKLAEEPNCRAVYVDCEALPGPAPENLEKKLSELIHPRPAAAKHWYPINELASRSGQSIYLFIDEADRVVEYCDVSDQAKAFYARIRHAATAEPPTMIVMAGWGALWEAVMNPLHQLHRLFEAVPLRPLDAQDAEDLIVDPITSLGVTFAQQGEIVTYIQRWSSCHPAYIQLFCSRLVERASGTRAELTLDDVHAVAADENLYEAITIPFLQAVPVADKAVTYVALGLGDCFDVAQIVERFRNDHSVPATANAVMRSCERLVVSNVFTRDGDHYKFLVGGFPSILKRRHSIPKLLGAIIEDAAATLCYK